MKMNLRSEISVSRTCVHAFEMSRSRDTKPYITTSINPLSQLEFSFHFARVQTRAYAHPFRYRRRELRTQIARRVGAAPSNGAPPTPPSHARSPNGCNNSCAFDRNNSTAEWISIARHGGATAATASSRRRGSANPPTVSLSANALRESARGTERTQRRAFGKDPSQVSRRELSSRPCDFGGRISSEVTVAVPVRRDAAPPT
ncbi:PREDICTED: uncharacterized protein LOC105560087 [Vollenhovia emeryi]|uniref:uncharacterized protein LOC105560087 n=1 Tax=Vollenhovia emeryi TaxID=411798 RepID=UPI0005F4776B|nr:PREDICTED: uncharacterized protein LOC105560087 [Vollenhovia emeryi]